ncbi:carbonic anhydrase/acetyltransferase-like protein (isoleucine patch superfamily) [Elusimicrobium posterum]|uniref:gamma carbonic anhydrase family protein n=1 Tax=Elusimicrobium posterum TaxID=3116653 RepID=UPI003C727534
MKERIKNLVPVVHSTCYVHKSAVLMGDVKLGENVSIWPNAVLRGDIAGIEVGENSNVQDNAVIHVNHDRPVTIGKGTTLGHGVVVHGSVIGDNCLIGMNAVVLESELGDNCVIGAGSVLTAGKKIPSGSLVMGVPAKIIRQLTEDEINGILVNCKEYIELSALCKEEAQEI